MSEPDDVLRRAYAAYRQGEAPSAAERSEVWAQLEQRIGAGESGPRLIDTQTGAPTRARWVRPVAIVASLAAAVLLMWWVSDIGSVVARDEQSSSGSQAIDQAVRSDDGQRASSAEHGAKAERGRGSARASDGRVDGEPPAESSPVAPIEVVPSPPTPTTAPALGGEPAAVAKPEPGRSTKRPRSTPSSEPTPTVREPAVPSTIVDEAALLRRARSALRRDDGARALALVREHADRFPDGALAPERGLLEIDVLCRLERIHDARAAAKRHAARFPESGWSTRIARTCARP